MRITLILFFFCYIYPVSAQSLFIFERLTKDTAIVYRGMDNYIKITDYEKEATYEVLARQGVIRMGDEGYFTYQGTGIGTSYDTLTLYKNKRWQGSVKLTVARIPNPQVRLAGGIPGRLGKSWVLAAPYIVALFPGCYFKCFLRVSGFELVIARGNMETHFRISGNQISADALKLISTYKGRMKLYFDNVRFGGCGSCSLSTGFIYALY